MTTAKKTPAKVHVTVTMTHSEAAQLMQLRARIELSTLKRLSTSQVLREAIHQAYADRETAPLAVFRPAEARTERFDLIVDGETRGLIEELRGMHEGATVNDVVVAAALAAKEQIRHAKPKRIAPRPR
jgi:hypothetical protein